MLSPLSACIKELIRMIPEGKVCTYGLIARYAGNRRAARQVARLLHACSEKEGLPWHRVVDRHGRIALPPFQGYERQKRRLMAEGVQFSEDGLIDFEHYLWWPISFKSPGHRTEEGEK